MLQTEAHRKAEDALLARCGEAWRCTMHRFPTYHPIDAYAERKFELTAYLEVKARQIPSDKYGSEVLTLGRVFELKRQKWAYPEIPVTVVIGHTDGVVRFLEIDVLDVDDLHVVRKQCSHVQVAGRAGFGYETNVEIPNSQWRVL